MSPALLFFVGQSYSARLAANLRPIRLIVKHRLQLVIFAAALTGFLLPGLAVLDWCVPWLIGIILFVNFSEVDVGPRHLLRPELLLTVPLSALVMPAIVFLLTPRSMDPGFRVGILLTAIAPAGIMPLVIGRFLRGVDYPLILGNFLATTFGSVFYLPPMLHRLIGAEVDMDAGSLFARTAALILLPYAAGLALNRTLGSGRRRLLDRHAPRAVLVIMFAIVALVISKGRGALVWSADLALVTAMVLAIFAVQGLLAWLGGFLPWFRASRTTLGILGSSRNNQVSLGIAMLQFPPAAAIPCIIGFIVHHLYSALWLWVLRKD